MKRLGSASLTSEHTPESIKRRLAQTAKPSFFSDAVLGAIDGCVTTFAIVSGTVGAGFSASVALVMGIANLIADGFSMAISNYEANKAQEEFAASIRRSEEEHIETIPEGEREEIRQIFQGKGFSGEVLEQIVDTITSDRKLWIDTMLVEEHGLISGRLDPLKSGLATFGAFILVGAMPLIPFMFYALDMLTQFALSCAIAASMFFAIGATKSAVYNRPILTSGLKTLLTGGAAAGLAFASGYVLRVVFGLGEA